MGSLLPGWHTDNVKPPIGVGEELLEERRSIERDALRCSKRPSVDASHSAAIGPPLLARTSAPSSFVIRKLQQAFSDELDDEENDGGEEEEARIRLFSRDKWWKKFSSGRLNEMGRDFDETKGHQTYRSQFEIAGGDNYLKKA